MILNSIDIDGRPYIEIPNTQQTQPIKPPTINEVPLELESDRVSMQPQNPEQINTQTLEVIAAIRDLMTTTEETKHTDNNQNSIIVTTEHNQGSNLQTNSITQIEEQLSPEYPFCMRYKIPIIICILCTGIILIITTTIITNKNH